MNNPTPPRREAQTDIDLTTLVPPRLSDLAGTAQPPATPPATADGVKDIDALLAEMGVVLPPTTDPLGVVTTKKSLDPKRTGGDTLTLRELDGEDETMVDVFLEKRGLTASGGGQASNLRFRALLSVDRINDEEQAPVTHDAQLSRLLKYKASDQSRIVGAFMRFNLSLNDGGGPFRRES
jgi:hypothetical protein